MGIFSEDEEFAYVDLKEYQIDLEVARKILKRMAKCFGVIPIAEEKDEIIVAASSPLGRKSLGDLELILGSKIKLVRSDKEDIEEKIGQYLYDTYEDYERQIDVEREIKHINLRNYRINLEAIKTISGRIALQHCAIPIDFKDEKVVIAAPAMLKNDVIKALELIIGAEVVLVTSRREDILQKIEDYYRQEFLEEELVSLTRKREIYIPYINLVRFDINPEAAKVLSRKIVEEHCIIPIDFDRDKLVIACPGTLDNDVVKSIEIVTGKKIRLVAAKRVVILKKISEFYQAEEKEPIEEKVAEEACSVVDEVDLTKYHAEEKLPLVDLNTYNINDEALVTVSKKIALRFSALPVDFEGENVLVAVPEKLDQASLEALEVILGSKVKLVQCEKKKIIEKIEEYF